MASVKGTIMVAGRGKAEGTALDNGTIIGPPGRIRKRRGERRRMRRQVVVLAQGRRSRQKARRGRSSPRASQPDKIRANP
jgi:hypothetical protein